MSDPGFLADVMAHGPEEAKQLLRRLGLYTHIGWKDGVNYQFRSSRLYGHREPKAGKTHALTQEDHPQLGTRWRALCGEVVHDNGGKDEYGDAITPNVRPAPDENGGGVTCKRCKQVFRKGSHVSA